MLWDRGLFVTVHCQLPMHTPTLCHKLVTWLLPMTHLIELVRPLTAGQSVPPGEFLLHLSYLIALAVLAFGLAYRRLRVRMFD